MKKPIFNIIAGVMIGVMLMIGVVVLLNMKPDNDNVMAQKPDTSVTEQTELSEESEFTESEEVVPETEIEEETQVSETEIETEHQEDLIDELQFEEEEECIEYFSIHTCKYDSHVFSRYKFCATKIRCFESTSQKSPNVVE